MTDAANADSNGRTDSRRILIAIPNWIGDVVMATPTLSALRDRFAHTEITFLMRPYVSQVLSGSGLADREIFWPAKDAPSDGRHTKSTWQLVGALKTQRFDMAVLLTNSLRSALIAWLARIPQRVGYARDRRSWLLTDKLTPLRTGRSYTPIPAIDYYNEIARRLGCTDVDRTMRLNVHDDDKTRLAERIGARDKHRPLVVLNPGANYGSAKCWPAEKYAALSDLLVRELGASVVASLSPKEARIADALAAAAREPIDILVGLGIGPLKALIARSDLLISNDTGPRHFAPALNVPVVTIFGSSDPQWAHTYSEKERIVKLDLDCQPCMARTCPLGHHNCMRELPADMVFHAARDLLRCEPGSKRVEA